MPRLDQSLVERGICRSREQAKRLVMAGKIRVNGQIAHKASHAIAADDVLTLDEPEKYVSRGGLKLEHALRQFQLRVDEAVAIDLGASTGGFTDCLLQSGATRVFCVDVGRGQLAWKLRNDPRVIVMEQTNARLLTPVSFPPPFTVADIIVIDCSFISLRKIIPVAVKLLRPAGYIVALIKPQFEAGKRETDRGKGVIRDSAIHRRVLDELKEFVDAQPDLRWRRVTESPIVGPAGNKEFLALLEKSG